jgi:Domain of unknown function (DUF4442)
MNNHSPQPFLNILKHPVTFRMFLFSKLPSAYFSGVRVKEATTQKAVVTVPYKWFSQNPFRSTYFACLAMAAELSTGVLAMMYIYKRVPAVSMLVTNMEAGYYKKATGRTYFVCTQGAEIRDAVERAIATGEGQQVVVHSTGSNEAGERVAEFVFTWSFKAKSN